LKLAVASLIRNEIDIIVAFLQHLDALFEYALLMNHGSIDGTDRVMADACERKPGWRMWQVDAIGYHQAAFNLFALDHLVRNTDADYFMFLDADEFIDVSDRAHLETAFAELTDPDRVGTLRWRNIVPDRLDTRAVRPGETVWRPPGTAQLGKVVIPRTYFERHGHAMHLSGGNHFAYYTPENTVPQDEIGAILHLPVRSHAQLKGKVVAGVFAVMAQASLQPVQCWHWYDILWRIGDGTLRDEDLIGIAAHYGEQGAQSSMPTSWADLERAGYCRTTLDVAFGDAVLAPSDIPSIDPVRLVATILRRFQVEDVSNSRLTLDGDRLHFVPNESKP
jgi:hypothetical protein